MLHITFSISEAVQRIRIRDSTLQMIYLVDKNITDEELAELIDYLLAYPDAVINVYLERNQLTDKTGIKLARYVASSSTIQTLSLRNNQFGNVTYLAMAAALQVNTSVDHLYLHNDQIVTQPCLDVAFINAIILNPNRPVKSLWLLYPDDYRKFEELKAAAEKLGHPSMQAMLATQTTQALLTTHPIR